MLLMIVVDSDVMFVKYSCKTILKPVLQYAVAANVCKLWHYSSL